MCQPTLRKAATDTLVEAGQTLFLSPVEEVVNPEPKCDPIQNAMNGNLMAF